MAGWKRLICWLARALSTLRRWHHGRVIKWENRYIDQYRKQIDDALEGIVIAKKRRAEAEARRQTTFRPGLVSGKGKPCNQ